MNEHDDLCPRVRMAWEDVPCECRLIREVRTDEAKRMNERWRTQVLDNEREKVKIEIQADIQAKVARLEALVTSATLDSTDALVWRSQVLALVGGNG